MEGVNSELRSLYTVFYKNNGLLPDRVSVQRPRILFDMLGRINSDKNEEKTEIPENLKWFYGG